MKYAVPVSGGAVSAHFGHCERFNFYEVDPAAKKIVAKESAPAPSHEPGLLPQWLAAKGVSLVIAGGMGSRAQSLFQQKGISVVTGVTESDPEKAVLLHVNGGLAAGANICDH